MIRLLLLLLLLPLPAQALLHYQGETSLYQDTVWEGEVLIDGILTVAMGTTLEIRPGTVVRFTRFDSNADQIGEHEIFIQGRLLARGSAAAPILFTSAEQQPRSGDWGALNMMMSEEGQNIFEHCVVEYAYRGFHAHFSKAELRNSRFRFNQRGAQFQESDVVIEDCTFADNFNGLQFRDSTVVLRRSKVQNNQWGVRAVFVKLRLEECQITGNRTNGISLRDSEFSLQGNLLQGNRRGIYLQRSRGSASANRIIGNLEHGIYLEDSIAEISANQIVDNGRSGVKVQHAGGRIFENSISGNHQFTFVTDGPDDLRIGANWYAGQPVAILDQKLRPELGSIVLAPALPSTPLTGH
ncbi:MAG TPA: right-handed parallel beta-helix repeat-containing protein [Malonomonas sp.]